MTIQRGSELLQPFIDQCGKDKDPFYIAHFSRQEDKYEGYFDGLDEFDAAILVKQLVSHFKMNEVLVNSLVQ